MKKIIISRHLDELGRVPIPLEFRKELGIIINKDVSVFLSDPNEDRIITVDVNSDKSNAAIQAYLGLLSISPKYRYENELLYCMIDIWLEDGKLHLKKTVPQCIISGETENLIRYKNTNKYISKQAIRELYEMQSIN